MSKEAPTTDAMDPMDPMDPMDEILEGRPTHDTHEAGAGDASDNVSAWLDGLVRVMRLPKREAGEIREELDSHVRDRVGDLMLVGESEPKAIHHAISELGDAALLAQRYKHARGVSQRRWIMTAATLAIASGALVISTMTLSGSPMGADHQSDNVAPITAMPVESDRIREVLGSKIEIGEETSYREFFDQIRDAAGGSVVDASVFSLDLNEPMGISADGVSIGTVLDLVNRRDMYEPIVLVSADAGVEITTQEELDHAQTRLVAYDIASILNEGVEPDEIVHLMTTFVEPEHWLDNGGDIAGHQIVGTRLFIQAPPRFAPRIEWILDQLASAELRERAERLWEDRPEGLELSRPSPDATPEELRQYIRILQSELRKPKAAVALDGER